jgi:hypothetical protein
MSSDSVCQVARSWVDVGSFHTCLLGVVYMNCGDFHDGSEKKTVSVQHCVNAISGKTRSDCHSNPPYSPDLAPCDFFLFPKIKLKLKGCRFDTIEEIQAESQIVFNSGVPRIFFRGGFNKFS